MQNEARCVISHDDPLYPHMLLDLPGEPPRLFVRGAAEVLSMPSIAVVGSRRRNRRCFGWGDRLRSGCGQERRS